MQVNSIKDKNQQSKSQNTVYYSSLSDTVLGIYCSDPKTDLAPVTFTRTVTKYLLDFATHLHIQELAGTQQDTEML